MSWMICGIIGFNLFIAGRQVGLHWQAWAQPLFKSEPVKAKSKEGK